VRRILLTAALALVALAALAPMASASSSCWYSPRGCVSVGGYVKPSSGTYVSPYFRNYPSTPSYRTPSYRVPSYRTPSYRVPSYRTPSYRVRGYRSSW